MVDSLAWASFDPTLPYARARHWKPLPPSKNFSLPGIQALTIAGLVGIPAGWIGGLQWCGQVFGELKNKVVILGWQQPMAIDIPWVPLTGLAIGAMVANPGFIRSQLHRSGTLKRLSTEQLSQYSPEAYRVLQRSCQSKKQAIPHLEIIETDLPLVMSYGLIPQQQTIAVSRCILHNLKDSEIATLYALEISHIQNWTTAILSTSTTLALLPYLLYWECAQWGDRFLDLARQPQKIPAFAWIWKVAGGTFGIVASASYGAFAGLRWMGLWLSRSRTDVADRRVCDLTGNPNGLASALMQLRSLMAQALNTEPPSPFLLEALEHLLPVARPASATAPLSAVESWWTLNQPQRPIETRLANLGTIARHWNLVPILPAHEFPFGFPSPAVWTWAKPWTWAIGGYGLAGLAWGFSWLTYAMGQPQFAFLGSDHTLFIGLSLLGFGLGTWMRFNDFFPDLSHGMSRCDRSNLTAEQRDQWCQENLTLMRTFQQPTATPLQPKKVMLSGQLKGHWGVANWLGQDLWLELDSGEKIKLHFGSSLGSLGRLLRELWGDRTLAQSVGESVTVSGWLRRGATIWMDVEAARTNRGVIVGGHQIGSILIGALCIGVGLLVML